MRAAPRSRARRTARRRARRRARMRAVVGVLGAGILAVGLVAAAVRLGAPSATGPSAAGPDATDSAAEEREQDSLVLVTVGDDADRPRVHHVVVLAAGPTEGTLLLVPPGTLAEVPGHGLLPLGEAYAFGGAALLDASLDNLLGVDLDHVVGVNRRDWSRLVDRVGGLRVDPGTDAPVRDGATVAARLTERDAGESQLAFLARLQPVLEALLGGLTAPPGGPGGLGRLLPEPTPAPAPGFVSGLLERLSALADEGRVVTRSLPVAPLEGDERGSTYRVDAVRTRALVAERLAASAPEGSGDGRDLQILNANGIPGIGQEVAERLVPAGFRVVLTGNAARFDQRRTRILIYSDSARQRRIAREIRERLGVGVIERSTAPQSVVDVTVVVGGDFPPDGPTTGRAG